MEPPVEHLFRHEAGRITATLVRVLGLRNLRLAEDVVQEAFCRALEVWPFRGTPQDPAAWLMATARNCAMDGLRRDRTAQRSAAGVVAALQSEWTLGVTLEELFAPHEVRDDLLRMMFSCCHPQLPEIAQAALILHILCGFSVDEVAAAFINTHAAMEKRLTRARKTLAQSRALFNVASVRDFHARLPAVQRALYLLFNEGYHGASPEVAVNAELCAEARRLTALLLEHPLAATTTSHALAALMAFNAARLPGRLDAGGELLALADQDRSRWDHSLIAEGCGLLERSASGEVVTPYHVEAAIASLHVAAPTFAETDWRGVIALYDALMSISPSPVVALNRAIAIAQAHGPQRGLDALQEIADRERLADYPFLSSAMGEMELRCGRSAQAMPHFQAALRQARNPAERRFVERRIQACAAGGG
ncbi:MAG: sigma factor, ECF subfamily protein [Proteobacteria bacterium]|nr:sigma factor, ECF subfamily protein [Pseudomonadota bacterium]